MDDNYEKQIQKFIDQNNISEREANKASSFSEKASKAAGRGIQISNPEYRLGGTNTPYRGKETYKGKYDYISSDTAKGIVKGKRQSTSHGIWKQVNSPDWMSGRVQQTIEELINIKDGDVLVSLDIESLGTASFQEGSTGHFGITQVAATPYRVDFNNKNGPLVMIPGEKVNVLTRPNNETMDWISKTIDKLDESGIVPNLSAEEYRTLKDLIPLAGDARYGDASGVILKTNSFAISDGANLKKYKEQIREGYNRLKNKSLSITEGFDKINKQMFTGGYSLGNNFKYMTTNGLDFDMPGLLEEGGSVLPKGNGHVDFLQAMRITHGDVFSDFYKGKGKEKISGLTQLDNIFEATFGMNMQAAGLKAHYASDDTVGLGKVMNEILPDLINKARQGVRNGKHDIAGKYGKGIKSSVEYNTEMMENGMTFFSRGSAFKGSNIDTVIDFNNKKNIVRSVGPAISKNRTYKLIDQFMQDGHYSALLHNLEDDVYTVVGRESKEELQTLMQKSLVPFSSKMPGYKEARSYSVSDAARREYESIFVGDGSFWKAKKYTKIIDDMQNKAGSTKIHDMTQAQFSSFLSHNDFGLTKTQKRNMKQFYKRLSAESPIIKSFTEQVTRAGLDGTNADLAMENFRDSMNKEIVNPVKNLKLPSAMNQTELFVPNSIGIVRRGVDATNFSTLEAGIRSLITGGVQNSNMNFSNVVDNFNQIVSDLVGQGVLSMEEGKTLLKESSLFVSGKGKKTSGARYLSQLLTNNIGNKLKKVNTINGVADLEAVSHVAGGLKNQSQLFSSAINSAKDLITHSSSGLALTADAKNYIDKSHIQKVMKLQRELGLPDTKMPLPMSAQIEAFAESLAREDVYMSVYIDEKSGRGLKLAMYAKEHATDVMRKGVNSKHAAVVHVPLAKDDMLLSGGVNKANILYTIMGGDGKEGNTWISTTQQQVMFKLTNSTDRIVDAFKMGNVGEAARVMNKAVSRALNPLSSMSRYGDVADELDFSSRGANWLRTNLVNISPLSDKILKGYGLNFKDLTLSQTNDLIRDVLHGSAGNYKTEYGEKIQKEILGLNLDLGLSSTKTELATKGMFSKADARWLIPFGTYNTATREFNYQAQNYRSLNPDGIKEPFRNRINPVIMTDVAQEVYNGEITGLMVKTANVNDIQLKKIMGDTWDELGVGEKPSTYDSMILMKQSTADQFLSYDRKKIRIDAGSGLEFQDGLLTALENNGTYSIGKGEVITLGRVMKDNNGKPIGSAADPLQYKSKNGAIIRGVSQLENGGYQFDIDEIISNDRGAKFISEFGDKGTLRIISDNSWHKLGEPFEKAEMLFSGGTYDNKKRPPAMTVVAELDYAVSEYLQKYVTADDITLRTIQRDNAEKHVVEVIGKMLGSTEGISYRNYDMVHGAERVLTVPGRSKFKDITWSNLNTAVGELGVKQGEVRLGLTQMRRAMVEEYPAFIGSRKGSNSKFEGIKWGMRELEMLESRDSRYRSSGGPDISPLYNSLKSNIYNFSPDNIKENKGIWNVIELSRTKKLSEEYSTYTSADLKEKGIGDLPYRPNGYSPSDFARTILDKDLSNGKEGFILKLPETMQVGKRGYVDEIFMPSFDNKATKSGIVQTNPLQNYQRGIFRSIQEYEEGMSDGDHKLAMHGYEGMQKYVPAYILEAQKQAFGSNGSIVKSTLEGRLKNSGRTIAQGYGVGDLFDSAGNIVAEKVAKQEGRVGISRGNMKTALQGLGDADIRELIDLTGGDASKAGKGRKQAMESLLDTLSDPKSKGLAGLVNRYPTIGEGSIMAANYFIENSATDSTSLLTVGLASILRADNDGDNIAHIFGWMGGSKRTKFLNKEAYAANVALFEKEKPMLADIATAVLSKFKTDVSGNSYLDLSKISEAAGRQGADKLDDKIASQYGNDIADRLVTEARIGKSVGPFSNISHALRKEAFTIGDMSKDGLLYATVSAFSEQLEQKTISSKKFEEMVAKSNTKGDLIERIDQYTSALDRLRSTDIYNMDIESMLDDATTIDILDKNGLTGDYGIQLKHKANRRGTREEVAEALGIIKDYFPKGSKDPQAMLFDSEPYDIDKGNLIADAIMNNKETLPLANVSLFKQATGGRLDTEQAAKNLSNRILKNTSKAGNSTNEIPVAEMVGNAQETIGKNKTDNILGGIGKMFNNISGGAAAIGAAALGAWALSGIVRGGPKIEHQPVEAYEDQAPSSDGTYVNPMAYAAGAPAGAGPSAYVSPRGTGYERINVNIKGNISQGMTNNEVSQLISDEVRRQSGIDMNLNISSEDNRQTIDKQWLQTQFASALKTGYVY